MKLKVYLAAGALVLSSLSMHAAEHKHPAMSAEEKAQMDAMMKAGAVGPEHKNLAHMAGTWNATVKMWPKPGAEPGTSKGVSTNKAILGGRWIQQDFKGDFMGMPFTGLGFTGYDNVSKKYVGTWMDSMSTGAMVSSGTADGDNGYTFKSTMPDPMTGKDVDMKTTITVVSKNKHVMEMWGPATDGTPFKMMEITYTRKK